jgi:hypothetical protein
MKLYVKLSDLIPAGSKAFSIPISTDLHLHNRFLYTDALTTLSGQGARAGIHNIVIVDQTDGESLLRSIKSNIPARVVMRLSSAGESKAIDILEQVANGLMV